MLYAKFGWNWHSDSGEADFIILWMHYRFFGYYLPLEKGKAIYLNELETPLPKNVLH